MTGHTLSDVSDAIKDCVELLPPGAVGWIRQIDSVRDAGILVEWMHELGERSLSNEVALFTVDALVRIQQKQTFTFFTEVWLFPTQPSADAIQAVPSVELTADWGPMTERPADAAAIEDIAARLGVIAAFGDGDGLNFYCKDDELRRRIEKTPPYGPGS